MNQRISLVEKTQPRVRRQVEMQVNRNLHQKLVDEYFQTNAEYWKSVYGERNLNSIIYQYRHAVALHIVDELNLPKESNVLEIGCGAGILTMALAQIGRASCRERV